MAKFGHEAEKERYNRRICRVSHNSLSLSLSLSLVKLCKFLLLVVVVNNEVVAAIHDQPKKTSL